MSKSQFKLISLKAALIIVLGGTFCAFMGAANAQQSPANNSSTTTGAALTNNNASPLQALTSALPKATGSSASTTGPVPDKLPAATAAPTNVNPVSKNIGGVKGAPKLPNLVGPIDAPPVPTPPSDAIPASDAAPALPGGTPVLPGQADASGAVLPGSDISDNPGMTLNANEAGAPNAPQDANGIDLKKTAEEIETQKRKEAFNAALQGILPLKPDEIRSLLEHFDRTQESVELPVYPSPKPEVAVETVSLDPGAKPVVVKVAYGNVTTLTFLDITGQPWPIEDISWAGNFEVVNSSNDAGSHILRITPQSEFGNGNMSIRLLTLKTPVIISLQTNRDIVHYRFDAVIPQNGPNASTPLIDKGITISAGNGDLTSVLEGAIPTDAKKMNVAGVDGRTTAYKFKGSTYVRTPLTLLSPAWNSSVTSADGTRVYVIQDSPVLLLSDRGQMVRARLSDQEHTVDPPKLEEPKHD